MPELLAALCLLGLIVSGGFGCWSLIGDLKRDATIRRRLREG
jgi:hypothetical protein